MAGGKIIDFITAPSIADNDYLAMSDSNGNTRKILKSNLIQIKNDLITTATGSVLDASQGKVIDDKITTNTTDINKLKEQVNQPSLTNIEIGSSPITTLTGMLDGFVDSLKFKGKTRYKTTSNTYTDTYTSGVILESSGEVEGKMIMTSLKPDNTVGDTLNVTISKPLRSLGLITDVLDVVKKTITRNIGQVILKGASTENWVQGTPLLQTNTLQFKIQVADGKIGLSPTDINVMCDKFPSDTSANNISNDSESIAFDDNGYVLVRILKSRLATQDVAGFKLWLSSVNITIIYQLLNQITESFKQVATLQTFQDGYLQLENLIVPTVNFSYPVKLASVVDEHNKIIDNLADTVVDNSNKIGDLIITTPQKTNSNTTYYVNITTGNDANDGLTNSTSFKTINKAISKIPQIVNHTIIINVANGMYPEDPVFKGLLGYGKIIFNGGTSYTDPANYIVTSISIINCGIEVDIIGLRTQNAGTNYASGISNINSKFVKIDKCSSIANGISTNSRAVYSSCGNTFVTNSSFSNMFQAILAENIGQIYSDNNTGSSNTYGLASQFGSTIYKSGGTQPIGVTNEYSSAGGAIR